MRYEIGLARLPLVLDLVLFSCSLEMPTVMLLSVVMCIATPRSGILCGEAQERTLKYMEDSVTWSLRLKSKQKRSFVNLA